MSKRTSLSDVACSSRPVSDFGWRLISFNGRACRGFRSAKWPGPTQPSLRAPGAPALSLCAPLLLSLSHLDFPRSNLPLPLPPLSLRGALGIGDGDHRNLDPEVSSPPLPSPLSPSLPLPHLLSPCARPLFSPLRACASLRGGASLLSHGAAAHPSRPRRGAPPSRPPTRRRGGPPLPFPHASRRPAAPLSPRGAAAHPSPSPRRRGSARPSHSPVAARPRRGGPGPRRGVRPSTRPPRPRRGVPAPRRGPCPGAQPPTRGLSPLRAAFGPCAQRPSPRRDSRGLVYPLTRSRVRKPTRAVIIFGFVVNFKLRKLACCVARRIYLISDPIDVLRPALHRATIHFNFRLFNV
jgi:hypothetical protein